MLARSTTQRPNTLMQRLTFVVLEVCLATRGRAIHIGTNSEDFGTAAIPAAFGVHLLCVGRHRTGNS